MGRVLLSLTNSHPSKCLLLPGAVILLGAFSLMEVSPSPFVLKVSNVSHAASLELRKGNIFGSCI